MLPLTDRLHWYAVDDDARGKAIYYVERGKTLREAVAEIIRLQDELRALVRLTDPHNSRSSQNGCS